MSIVFFPECSSDSGIGRTRIARRRLTSMRVRVRVRHLVDVTVDGHFEGFRGCSRCTKRCRSNTPARLRSSRRSGSSKWGNASCNRASSRG